MNKAAIRRLKAVLHRRRLAERLPKLEQELMALCLSGCDQLGGYRLRIECGELVLEKQPELNAKQLALHLTWRSAELSVSESSGTFKQERERSDRDGGEDQEPDNQCECQRG